VRWERVAAAPRDPGELGLLAAIGQHAVVADALDACGQHMQQQTPDELFGGQFHASLAAVIVGTHREDHCGGVRCLDALVADGIRSAPC
jgi:hypothetical protein